ncbi:MAG: FAD-dependent oxidoreductase [Terracidiphilus sp.]
MIAELPILIVGSGPTGLTLACDLARRNISIRIIDKAPEYFNSSRGKALQPRSLEVLDDLGIIDRILANGRFHLPFRAYNGATILGEKDVHEGLNPTPDIPYASPLIIPQWRVEDILRDCLKAYGVHVELSTQITEIEQNDDCVIATLQHGGAFERVHCRYLVGADGGHSFVRKALDFSFEGESWTDERMYVGDVMLDNLDRDHWHSWPNHPDGWVALCPLPSTDAFQFQAQIPPGAEAEPSLQTFQHILDTRTARNDLKLGGATWISLYRANVRMVDRYRQRRVFLAGDAAHVHSPAGGQGMNTGIQDAYNLGWKLAAALQYGADSLLATYEEERLPVAASVLGISSRLHRGMSSRDAQSLRRDAGTLQLGINYRGASLSRQHSAVSAQLQAGDRAPDSPVVGHDGLTHRLFDLFRGPHWTLLGLGACNRDTLDRTGRHFAGDLRVVCIARNLSPGSEASLPTLIDNQGLVAQFYGPADALVLVRPDGYIACIADPTSSEFIEDYLQPLICPS